MHTSYIYNKHIYLNKWKSIFVTNTQKINKTKYKQKKKQNKKKENN